MIRFRLVYPFVGAFLLACSIHPSSALEQRPIKQVPSADSPDSIRSIDFRQISYPHFRDVDGNRITTKPGKELPVFLEYGDVTGDDKEEALVVLAEETRGTAIPYHVYIFSSREAKPLLLADIETCDRADGGLRRVFAQGGHLILELYGRGKTLGSDLCADDGTRKETPYPYAVTRSRYTWRDERFVQVGLAEVFSDESNYGAPIMKENNQ